MDEYIKREALIQVVQESKFYNNHSNAIAKTIHRHEHDHFLRLIDIQYAADVVEVVHGKWEEADDGDGVVCSICREDFCNLYLEVDRFKYCPNCGARMDSENND